MSEAAKLNRLFVSYGDMPEDVWQDNVVGRYRTANHLVPFYVFVPMVLGLAIYALGFANVSPLTFSLWFLIGIPFWTINEYTTHRFLFHLKSSHELIRRLVYTMHTGHHDYPNDRRFILISINVSIPTVLLTGVAFYLLLGNAAFGLLAGWISSYLFYDWLHFATHAYNFQWRWFRAYKKHHLQHHFKYDDNNFGVVTFLWDYVAGTKLRLTANADPQKESAEALEDIAHGRLPADTSAVVMPGADTTTSS